MIPIPLLISSGTTLLNAIFGGSTRGSDFPERKQQLQNWLVRENLNGNDAKYVNPAFIKSNLFTDYGSNGYNWQTVIQSYLGQIRQALNGKTGSLANPGDPDYTTIIRAYIMKVDKADNDYNKNPYKNIDTNKNTGQTENVFSFLKSDYVRVILSVLALGIVGFIVFKKIKK